MLRRDKEIFKNYKMLPLDALGARLNVTKGEVTKAAHQMISKIFWLQESFEKADFLCCCENTRCSVCVCFSSSLFCNHVMS